MLSQLTKGWFSPATPEQILDRYLLNKSERDLDKLIRLFNPAIYHFIASLSDPELAKDITQNTWLKVMRVQQNQQSKTNVKQWLFTIARNTLIDELRKQQKWQWLEDEENLTSNISVELTLAKADELSKFNAAIAQLPFNQKEAFIFQQEGFSVEEIADMVHEPFETIKSRLRYARKHIKSQLGADNER